MWATLRPFEHNNLDGMTLIPAPKYGQTLLRSWARKHRSVSHLVRHGARICWVTYSIRMESWTPNAGVLYDCAAFPDSEEGAFAA